MFRLVHISDIHLSCVGPTLRNMWSSKRFVGGLNMLLFRRHEMLNDLFPRLLEDIQRRQPDLVAITGDLTTTSLHEEFALAHHFLHPFAQTTPLVTIPGNHDTYTEGSYREKRYERYFRDYHGQSTPNLDYPFAREVGEKIVIIGINTCLPTGWGEAWGEIDALQIQALDALLKQYDRHFRIILMHHHLRDRHGTTGSPKRGLHNHEALLSLFHKHGAELVLHGHEHACYHYSIEGKHRSIPVFDSGPATRKSEQTARQGGYLLFEIDANDIHTVKRIRYSPSNRCFEEDLVPHLP